MRWKKSREMWEKNKSTIELKPALETGQRKICNVEDSMIRDGACANEKSNKSKSLEQSKKKNETKLWI